MLGVLVSTETITSMRPTMASTAVSTRSDSSDSATGAAPGRVDSPPTSRISAPEPHLLGTPQHGIDLNATILIELAAVRKGIGCHIQDAHDTRRAEVQHSRTTGDSVRHGQVKRRRRAAGVRAQCSVAAPPIGLPAASEAPSSGAYRGRHQTNHSEDGESCLP